MGKCRQTRKHKCMIKISICSSQCNYPKKRQQFYRLVSFAQNTDAHMSGKNGETPRSSSSSSSASASRPKDQSTSFGESETSSDPITTRSATHACRKPMQTNPDKQALGNRGPADTEDETDEEEPTQGIPDWLQPFTVNLENLEMRVLAHSSEREISDSVGDA